ncbi:MAG TPA: tetratricopeptide repeat protein [Gammaproteobacteria bacterium]|nr:tetratricopeptide repeat protein [Gammaproteobacteria bacterium]
MMYLLVGLIFSMLASGIFLLAIPFIKTRKIYSSYFLLPVIFVILFSLSSYFFFQNHAGLGQWLMVGETHYELQQEVSQLGGLSGMIKQIKKRLAVNPDDAEGWFILGKLYLANQNKDEAREAFGKAMHLRPEDPDIKRFYDRVMQEE